VRCIEGLSVTADNYDDAIELLHNRFGKKQDLLSKASKRIFRFLLLDPFLTKNKSSFIKYEVLHCKEQSVLKITDFIEIYQYFTRCTEIIYLGLLL